MDKIKIARRQTWLSFSNTAKSEVFFFFSHTNKKIIYKHCSVKMMKLRIIQIWPQDEYFGSDFNRDDDVKQGCVANGNM